MDEKLKEFNNVVTTQVARYRMTKRENPCYLIVNGNTLQQLRRSYLTSFAPDGDYHNGLRVLVDNTLTDFNFKVVGE